MSGLSFLILAVIMAAFLALDWLISRHFHRRLDGIVREHFRSYADEINTFYVPMLEHQAQRDPEIADACELAIADLRGREKAMRSMADGHSWRGAREARRHEKDMKRREDQP